jgi:hypothetical protein
VEIIFTADRLNGGALYEDLSMLTYTREMETVRGWLTRAV